MQPDDLITLKEAAKLVGRSPSTIRRWIAHGQAGRWEGAMPSHGGAPLALVSTAEILACRSLTSKDSAPEATSRPTDKTPAATSHTDLSPTSHEYALRVAELTGDLKLSEALLTAERASVAAVRASLEHQQLAYETQLRELREATAEARRDRDDWRDRHDKLAAELRALRDASDRPWWRRMLTDRKSFDDY